ncbi:MAG: MBL fold metallo-hydrolase [Candidatus Binatia bacterium]|jgi:ribonuclease BN (tRNA processing enzyme)
MSDLRVTFLGSGDAFSAGGRHQAAYLVEAPEGGFLLDCGATTLMAMKRFGMDVGALDTIFISHLHGDHFVGIPFLLLEFHYEQERNRPLRIVGPPGTEERIRALLRATFKEFSGEPLSFALEFSEMAPDSRISCGASRIEAFRVPHQETEVSLGFVVQVAGRRIVYSGDTGWTEKLIARSEGADLFICECCYFETRLPFHLDYPRLAENRQRFTAKRIILTHLGREVLARRNEIEMELASDGLAVDI